MVNYGYMILFTLLDLAHQHKLCLRLQLEILLQIYLVEKVVSATGEHLEVILKHVAQYFTTNPQMLLHIYLNYDLQLFSSNITTNFLHVFPKLVFNYQ